MASSDVLNQLQGGLSTINPQGSINAQQAAQGVPQAAAQLGGLRGALNNTTNILSQVVPQVMGGAAHSLMSSAGASRVAANAAQPIQASIASQATALQPAESDLNAKAGEANLRAGNDINQQTGNLSYLQNLYSSMYGAEKNASDLAETQREDAAKAKYSTAQEAAAAAKSSSKSSKGSSSSSKPSIQDVINYYMQADSQYGAYNPSGTNNHRWQAAADELASLGFNTAHNSEADKLLTAAFKRNK